MANSAQARKRVRQSEKARQRNASQRSMMRTTMKKFAVALEGGDKEAANAAYVACVSAMDHAAGKGLLAKNKAARHKSRMNKAVVAMA